jgi:beta-1,4-mannosyl-glycoprotein beta-1,4-N-acetylglucosaminyltransferase
MSIFNSMSIIKKENFNEPRKIVDGFIFYNELALLEYRLNVLDSVVDHFVLVESRQTFTGKEKPLFFNDNKERFKKWLPKIIHIIVDLPHKNDAWANESIQRNAIQQGISAIELSKDDLIIISDVDEILDPNTLLSQKIDFTIDCSSVEMDMYYYNIEHKLGDPWRHVKLMTAGYLGHKTPDGIRRSNPNRVIKKGGWHLSYFGSAEFIRNKIQHFSHQEFNTEDITNTQHINEQIQKGGDVFHRPGFIIHTIKKEDNSYLPPHIEKLEYTLEK